MPVSPPGHTYPEVVSVHFPFPSQHVGTPALQTGFAAGFGRVQTGQSSSPHSPTAYGAGFGEDDEEVQRIRMEQVRLRERMDRLAQLAMLEEEEARLQRSLDERLRQIAAAEGRRRSSAVSGKATASRTSF